MRDERELYSVKCRGHIRSRVLLVYLGQVCSFYFRPSRAVRIQDVTFQVIPP